MDSQGRVLIPAMLREYGALEKRIVLMGQTNKLEIWDEQIWRTRREEWLTVTRESTFGNLSDLDGLSV
jgi:MraZ protein